MRWNRGRVALVMAVVLASPALAGCLGTAQATAMEHQSTAEDRAQEWADHPRLVEIKGIEGSFPAAFGMGGGFGDTNKDYWDRAREDPTKGDGHAEIWVYRFLSEQDPDTVFEVVVDKDGNIVDTDREPRQSDDEVLGDVEVDSDEAIETAKDASEGLDEGTSKDTYGLAMMLSKKDQHENPVWMIAGGGGDSSGGGGGYAIIDAVTGEVLEAGGGFGGPGGATSGSGR